MADDNFTESDQYFIDYQMTRSNNKNELLDMGYPTAMVQAATVPSLAVQIGGKTQLDETDEYFVQYFVDQGKSREKVVHSLMKRRRQS